MGWNVVARTPVPLWAPIITDADYFTLSGMLLPYSHQSHIHLSTFLPLHLCVHPSSTFPPTSIPFLPALNFRLTCSLSFIFFSPSCAFSQMSGHFAFHLFISIPPDHAFHYFHQSATVSWGHSFTIVLSKPSTLSLKTKVFKCKWKVNWTGYWRTWLQNSRLLTRQSNP